MFGFNSVSSFSSKIFNTDYNYGFSTAVASKKIGEDFKIGGKISATHCREFPNNISTNILGSVRKYGLQLFTKYESCSKKTSAELRLPTIKGVETFLHTEVCLADRQQNESKVGAAYQNDHINVSGEANISEQGVRTECRAIIGRQGYFVGGKIAHLRKTHREIVAGYRKGKFQAAVGTDGARCFASVNGEYRKFEGALQLCHQKGAKTIGAAAICYNGIENVKLKAKVASNGTLAAAASYKMCDGITVVGSGMLDLTATRNPHHRRCKVGFGLQLEL